MEKGASRRRPLQSWRAGLQALILLPALAGCAGHRAGETVSSAPSSAHEVHDTAGPGPRSDAAQALPFVRNDYEQALANARATGRPVLVEAWARW